VVPVEQTAVRTPKSCNAEVQRNGNVGVLVSATGTYMTSSCTALAGSTSVVFRHRLSHRVKKKEKEHRSAL
jgi:hypothetical protein